MSQYFSQYGQDKYLHETFFKDRRHGVFVEFGALDGLLDSNSLYFERELSWTGILIEPNPTAFARLEVNRPACTNLNVAIGDSVGQRPFLRIDGGLYGWSGLADDIEPEHRDRIAEYVEPDAVARIQVEVRDLRWLAEQHAPHPIDLMSIDTEGSEERIMRSFPWDTLKVAVFCIENNFNNYSIDDLMASHGYVKAARIGPDDIFCRRELIHESRP